MADPTLGEAVAGGFGAFLTGIGLSWKALKTRSNGNGSSHQYHDLDKRVALVERDIAGINEKLGDIKGDIEAIRNAVGGN